jgi:hypothetical protein
MASGTDIAGCRRCLLADCLLRAGRLADCLLRAGELTGSEVLG